MIHVDLAITTDRKGLRIFLVPNLSVPLQLLLSSHSRTESLLPMIIPQVCKAQLILCTFFLMGFTQF